MRKSVFNMRSVVLTALMSTIICVCSLLTIPVFTVPITLQTFAVYFALFMLGGKRGSIAVFLYVAMGAVGLPVFAGFMGGVGHLFDATGGFIFGFIISSLIFWLLSSILPGRAFFKLAAAAISLVFLYLVGILWYSVVYIGSTEEIPHMLFVCTVAFAFPDAVKIALAYAVSLRLSRIIKI